MKNLILFTFAIICILVAFSSCKKDEESEEPQPQPQKVEFVISYSGVSQTGLFDYRDLILLIEAPLPHPYYNFSTPCTDMELRNGRIITTPYAIEPGEYFVKGCWDWNKTETWDPLEPFVNPTPFKIDGFSTPRIEVQVLDRPEALAYSVGMILIMGENTGPAVSGEHYIRVFAKDLNNELVFHKQVYLVSGPTLNFDVAIDVGEYFYLTAYWDVDDNQQYSPYGDPHCMITHFYVSPGLTNSYWIDFFVNQ